MKKCIMLLITLLLLACSTTSKSKLENENDKKPYSKEELHFIFSLDTSDLYLVKGSFSLYGNNPNLRKIVILMNENEPIKIGDRGLVINSMLKVYIFNCKELKYSNKETYMYDKQFAAGTLLYERTIGTWNNLPENGGLLNMLRDVACENRQQVDNQ